MVFFFHIPEGSDRMSEPKQIEQKVLFPMVGVATFPIRNC